MYILVVLLLLLLLLLAKTQTDVVVHICSHFLIFIKI